MEFLPQLHFPEVSHVLWFSYHTSLFWDISIKLKINRYVLISILIEFSNQDIAAVRSILNIPDFLCEKPLKPKCSQSECYWLLGQGNQQFCMNTIEPCKNIIISTNFILHSSEEQRPPLSLSSGRNLHCLEQMRWVCYILSMISSSCKKIKIVHCTSDNASSRHDPIP